MGRPKTCNPCCAGGAGSSSSSSAFNSGAVNCCQATRYFDITVAGVGGTHPSTCLCTFFNRTWQVAYVGTFLGNDLYEQSIVSGSCTYRASMTVNSQCTGQVTFALKRVGDFVSVAQYNPATLDCDGTVTPSRSTQVSCTFPLTISVTGVV